MLALARALMAAAAADAARRAVARPRAADRARALRDRSSDHAEDGLAAARRRAERATSRSTSPTRAYVLEAGRIVARRARRDELRGDEGSAAPTWGAEWPPWTDSSSWSSTGSRPAAIYAQPGAGGRADLPLDRVVNFAQGEMAMFTTFIAWALLHPAAVWAAFALTLAIAFAGGIADRAGDHPAGRERPVLTLVIVTLGLLILVNSARRLDLGGASKRRSRACSRRGRRRRRRRISLAVDLGIVGGLARAWSACSTLFFRARSSGSRMRAAARQPGLEPARRHPRRADADDRLGDRRAARRARGLMIAPRLFLDAELDERRPALLVRRRHARRLRQPARRGDRRLVIGVAENLPGTYVDFIGSDLKLPVPRSRSSSASCWCSRPGCSARRRWRGAYEHGRLRWSLGRGAGPRGAPAVLLQRLSRRAVHAGGGLRDRGARAQLLVGYSGQISLGHGAFFALGGYTTAISSTDLGVPTCPRPARRRVARRRASCSACRRCGCAGLYLALVTFALARRDAG